MIGRLSFDVYGPAIAGAEALRAVAANGEVRLGAMTVEVPDDAIDAVPAPDGAQPVELQTLGRGDFFGEVTLFSEPARPTG